MEMAERFRLPVITLIDTPARTLALILKSAVFRKPSHKT